MTRSWVWWGVLSTLGVVVILLPDTGPRLFSLSEGHGPSLVDGVGILLLVTGWVVLDAATWRRRGTLSFPSGIVALMAIAAIGAAALVVWSISGDHGSWWIVGAVVLAAIQIAAAVRATIVEHSA